MSSVFSFQVTKDILIVLVTFRLQLDGHYSLKNQAGDLYYQCQPIYRISCKVSRAIFYNLSLLGATNFQGFQDFYLINKPFWCDYVLRATMYRGRIRIQEIRY